MNNHLMLEIKNFGLINEANIEINKINVVGGINSSGKSTASKLLYCFLKANASKRKEYLLSDLISFVNDFIKADKKLNLNQLSINDDFSDILKIYYHYRNIIVDNFINNDYDGEVIDQMDTLIEWMSLDDSELSSILTSNYVIGESLENFIDKSFYYCGEEFGHDSSAKFYGENFQSIVQRIKSFEKDNDSVIREVGDSQCSNEYFDFLTKGSLKNIEDVFYISPISIFDMYYNGRSLFSRNYGYFFEEHINDLLNNLSKFPNNILSVETIEKINHVQQKIENIIKGNFRSSSSFDNKFYRSTSNNTSSGTKQIGVIQILLNHHKLTPGTFLIIDEPEVNLHPEWQFKFAEILILLVKELNVNLYINSHSPLFIESIDAFCEFYDMENDVNYFLTEKFETEYYEDKSIHEHMGTKEYDLIKEFETKFRFNFTKIESNELYRVYDNLGNPYHLIDHLRIRKRLGE